jgi:hypothetical protein
MGARGDYADLDLPPPPRWWTMEFVSALALVAVMGLVLMGLIFLLVWSIGNR